MPLPKEPLTIAERAKRVIASQGKSELLYQSATEAELATLAELCDEAGALATDTPQKFRAFHIQFYADRKAADDTPQGAGPASPVPSPESPMNPTDVAGSGMAADGREATGDLVEEPTELDESSHSTVANAEHDQNADP